jgi:Ca2+-binding RTX toxin-like protein
MIASMQGAGTVHVLIAFAACASAAAVMPSPASAAPHCFGKAATIVGTKGEEESLRGTPGADVIVTRGDRDHVWAKGGDDRVCGKGYVFIHGGGGDDRVNAKGVMWGEAGDDLLKGSPGPRDTASYTTGGGVTVNLETGEATGQGDDRLRRIKDVSGSEHPDTLIGGPARNQLNGKGGEDGIFGGGGNDYIIGGKGDDTGAGIILGLDGGPGDDAISGFPGDDFLQGGLGDDHLEGGEKSENGAGDIGDGGEGDEEEGDECAELESPSNCEFFA